MSGRSVPIYDLYGERRSEKPDFWVHCETIAVRSSAHDWEIKPHSHDAFFQILYICAGTGDALIDGDRIVMKPPCVVLMPPRVTHGYRFSRDIEGFVITVVADRLPLTTVLLHRQKNWLDLPRIVRLDEDNVGYIDATIRELAKEFESRPSQAGGLMEALVTTTILLAKRADVAEEPAVHSSLQHARVDDLVALIDARFRDHLPAERYATLLNVSPTHLNRMVRAVTGRTVHDLIMARLMDEACRALVFSPASIQQISENLGYSDAAYFSRSFRMRMGQTPRGYRRSERLKLSEASE